MYLLPFRIIVNEKQSLAACDNECHQFESPVSGNLIQIGVFDNR
jgi:hypothetical protein